MSNSLSSQEKNKSRESVDYALNFRAVVLNLGGGSKDPVETLMKAVNLSPSSVFEYVYAMIHIKNFVFSEVHAYLDSLKVYEFRSKTSAQAEFKAFHLVYPTEESVIPRSVIMEFILIN